MGEKGVPLFEWVYIYWYEDYSYRETIGGDLKRLRRYSKLTKILSINLLRENLKLMVRTMIRSNYMIRTRML